MAKKIKTITLFNNYDGYDFEEWKKSFLEANCIEDVSDNVIWDYISMIEDEDFNNAIESLNEISCGNKWVVSGRLGLWNGTHDVTNIFSSTEDMVYAITKDCDYIKIWFENNNLFIQASHHDGTNTFQCKVLTNKGLEMFNIWNCGNSDCKVAKMNDYELYNLLFDNNFYSKRVKLIKSTTILM